MRQDGASVRNASHNARRHGYEGISAVVIDEAQDLSCFMIRMLYALVGDRPDGLNLIGDGQQTIYPGDYKLGEAGFPVAGRGVVLSTNYRNTRQIAEFAATIVEGDEFVDIEGGAGRADAAVAVPRVGPVPEVHPFTSVNELDTAVVAHIRSLVASGSTRVTWACSRTQIATSRRWILRCVPQESKRSCSPTIAARCRGA